MLLKPSALDLPSLPEHWFGRPGPVAVEVGIGSGQFVADFATAHPSWNVIGIDLSPASVARTYRLLRRRKLENTRLFKGDAHFFARHMAAPRSLHRVYVNFPDPWPRRKHAHRRLLRTPLLEVLSSRLAEGGMVLLTTDHDGFYGFALDEARASGLYHLEQPPPPREVRLSKYARKSSEAWGHTIQHAAFIKAAEHDAPTPELPIVAMHHAILEGPLPQPTDFERTTHAFRGGHVVLLNAYRTLDGEGLLFTVHLQEDTLAQDLLVEARPSRLGTYVGLKRFGEPLHTRGASAAVRAITRWLEARGMKLLHEKY